jgi:hypothetical protein
MTAQKGHNFDLIELKCLKEFLDVIFVGGAIQLLLTVEDV